MTLFGVAERSPVHREVLELDVGVEALRHAHHDFIDAQQKRHPRDRIDLVVGDHHQRRDRAAVILADLDHLAEQLALGVAENLAAVARGEPFLGAHGQRDQLGVVALGQVAMQMREIVGVADRNQFLMRREQAEANRIDLVFLDQFQIELLGLLAVGVRDLSVDLFRDLEHHEQRERETDARDGRDLLGEKVDDRGREQNYKRQREAQRKILAAGAEPGQVQRHPPHAMVLVLIAQDQHRQRFENEAPDDAEGVRLAQHEHVAAREHDSGDLQHRDHVHDAIVGAVLFVRVTEPVQQHAVFRDAGQHAGRADDRGVDGAGEDQEADEHHERAQRDPRPQRPNHEHREPADQVVAVVRHAHAVRNDHHREERDQRGQQQAVDENDHAGAQQILELGRLDLAIDLGQRFLARHREDRMAERDQNSQSADRARTREMLEPAERVVGELQFERRQMRASRIDREPAPYDHDHSHHGRDLHDSHRLAAGLLDAENVLAPEICRDGDGEEGGGEIGWQDDAGVRELEQFVNQTDQVLTGRHAAYGPGQDVVEHQGRDRDFRQRRSHRFFDDAIDAAAREHRARFHVHGAHRVREQHDGENEIGRRAAAGGLNDAADVVG